MKKILSLSIIILFIFFLNIDSFAKRGGSIGGFKRPSSSNRTYQPSTTTGGGGTYLPSYGFGGLPFISVIGGGGVPIVIIIIVGFFILKSVVAKKRRRSEGDIIDDNEEDAGGNLFLVQTGFYYGKGNLEKTLVQMGESIDTAQQEGLVRLLREMSMELQRNTESIRWFHFTKKEIGNVSSLEGQYRSLVNQERMKLEKEEFSDIDGVEVKRKEKFEEGLEEIIVVNMIVASYSGVLLDKKSTINYENLMKIMKFFSAIPDDRVLGVNITWNIMDRDDMLADYPEMRSV